jgi:hypothetical protein
VAAITRRSDTLQRRAQFCRATRRLVINVAFIPYSTNSSLLFGVLDNPRAGQVANKVLHSHGGLLQVVPLNTTVRFLLDDRPVAAQTEWLARPDVHQAYPHLVTGNPLPGFQAVLDLGQCLPVYRAHKMRFKTR